MARLAPTHAGPVPRTLLSIGFVPAPRRRRCLPPPPPPPRRPAASGPVEQQTQQAQPAAEASPAPHAAHRGDDDVSELVRNMLSSPTLERPEGAADPLASLRVMEAFWRAMRAPPAPDGAPPRPPRQVVRREPPGVSLGAPPEFDVAVAGGVLGLLLATPLQKAGHRVAVVEKRRVAGRGQEWNCSRDDLARLAAAGALPPAAIERCVVTEFNPVRVAFAGGPDVWVRDVLNVGLSPARLVAELRAEFEAAGGLVLEHTALKSARVADDGVELALAPAGGAAGAASAAMPLSPGDVNRPNGFDPTPAAPRAPRAALTARLLVDCMGHYSDIVKQARGPARPDGVVLVVGGCFDAVPGADASTGDLLVTLGDADAGLGLQPFWERFPAAGGAATTAYMFSYADAAPGRPSFAALLDAYFRALPGYVGAASAADLRFRRVLMGGFPCYVGASPLAPAWDRVVQAGDAAAGQSPLSFGGFTALARALPRLAAALDDALAADRLRRGDLRWLQPYAPSLSVAWLFQRAMSIGVGQLRPPRQEQQEPEGRQPALAPPEPRRGALPAGHVNALLRCNFAVMRRLGDGVLRPFVADTLRWLPLAATMIGMSLAAPRVVLTTVRQLGPRMVLSWGAHFLALGVYTLAALVARPLRPLLPRRWYVARRLADAVIWGAAMDGGVVAPAPAAAKAGGGGAAAQAT